MKSVYREKKVAILCFFLLLGGLSITGFAQPGDPGGGDPDVPITGIEWLLVTGGIFGARKIYKRIKKG